MKNDPKTRAEENNAQKGGLHATAFHKILIQSVSPCCEAKKDRLADKKKE